MPSEPKLMPSTQTFLSTTTGRSWLLRVPIDLSSHLYGWAPPHLLSITSINISWYNEWILAATFIEHLCLGKKVPKHFCFIEFKLTTSQNHDKILWDWHTITQLYKQGLWNTKKAPFLLLHGWWEAEWTSNPGRAAWVQGFRHWDLPGFCVWSLPFTMYLAKPFKLSELLLPHLLKGYHFWLHSVICQHILYAGFANSTVQHQYSSLNKDHYY